MKTHHGVFYNTKLTAVYLVGRRTGHAMRTCLLDLHPLPGTEAVRTGAGLFMKPIG